MKEQFKLELRPSSEQEKCFEGIPLRPKCVFKFVNWFFSVFQSLQMYCNIFCHLADSSSIKTNLEIVIFRQKNTYVQLFRSRHFRENQRNQVISCNIKLKALLEVKRKPLMVNCICNKILSENNHCRLHKPQELIITQYA